MLRWLGTLKLPLAAKCELLFGAAVALVILSAVSVPWLRMEQLTKQVNERAAEALVNSALDEHVAYWTRQKARTGEPDPASPTQIEQQPSTLPATGPAEIASAAAAPSATTSPATPTTAPSYPMQYGPAKLVLLERLAESGNALAKRTASRVDTNASEDRYWKLAREGDNYRYLFGRTLHSEPRCLNCHTVPTRALLPAHPDAIGIATVEFPSQVDVNELLLNRLYISLAALISGTLAVSFFYLIISRLILQPVRVLQETAEKVSEGDLNLRTHIPSGDEFQVLSQTFNRMLENLKEGEDQLRAINQTLDLKLAELSESNLALYESNRLKSEFLANVSHELRTPLNSILGFAELLRDNNKSDPKTARYVQNIITSGKSLLELINDLLDLAKIEAGKMEVRPAELSLTDMFEGLTGILRPLLESKSLVMKVSIASDVPLLHTDGAKLQQILYNFLSNAIKFSPTGAQIDLSAVRLGELRVRISVKDRGPGIPADKQLIIFEKFRQVDASHTRQYGGTGLGLAISQDLATLLGGKIGVDSQEGAGSTFWLELPIRIDAKTADVRNRHS